MVICICAHCGERGGLRSGDPVTTKCTLYCPRCKTLEQRAKMDAENATLGLKCNKCPMENDKSKAIQS